jgi:hypothetical protein
MSDVEPKGDGSCPPDYVKRKAYIIEKTGKIVPARCVKSTAKKESPKTRKCPPGQIYRQGYYRKYSNTIRREGYIVKRGSKMVRVHPQTDAIYIKPTCVDEREALEEEISFTGPLKKGQLLRYGYNFRLPTTSRHEALRKAERVYGAAFVFKILARFAKLFHTSKPEAAKVFAADRDWTRTTFRLGK